MSNLNLSDTDIEILLFGKWRFDKSGEKVSILFKDDMTFEETIIQTFLFSKPKELLTGNKFNGTWYVSNRKLNLNIRSIPKSVFNFQIPLFFKISLADIIASVGSIFVTQNYEIVEINSSKFLVKDVDQSIIGTKINYASRSQSF
ncbi:MAG: hypothetical protein PUP91_22720 [Rhizonema sp. PD37]|nr:hypothetical protein [Rhizonema sp. PD37]